MSLDMPLSVIWVNPKMIEELKAFFEKQVRLGNMDEFSVTRLKIYSSKYIPYGIILRGLEESPIFSQDLPVWTRLQLMREMEDDESDSEEG